MQQLNSLTSQVPLPEKSTIKEQNTFIIIEKEAFKN